MARLKWLMKTTFKDPGMETGVRLLSPHQISGLVHGTSQKAFMVNKGITIILTLKGGGGG